MAERPYRVPDWIMECECEVEAPWPTEVDWAAVTSIAVTALLNAAPEFDNPRLSASILFTTDAEVKELKHELTHEEGH